MPKTSLWGQTETEKKSGSTELNGKKKYPKTNTIIKEVFCTIIINFHIIEKTSISSTAFNQWTDQHNNPTWIFIFLFKTHEDDYGKSGPHTSRPPRPRQLLLTFRQVSQHHLQGSRHTLLCFSDVIRNMVSYIDLWVLVKQVRIFRQVIQANLSHGVTWHTSKAWTRWRLLSLTRTLGKKKEIPDIMMETQAWSFRGYCVR